MRFENGQLQYIPPMADQASRDDQQFSELIMAIKSGSTEQVEEILRNADPSIVNRIESQFREPSLYFAALVEGDERSAQLINLLIRHGANFRFKDNNQQTVLFYICRQGKQRCAEILMSHGLSLDDMDVYGQTPMFYAVRQGRLEIVRKYSTRERVNHQDKLAGQTPLYYAGQLEMAQLLVEKGADVTLVDLSNKTAVEYQRKMKQLDVAEYLANQFKKVKDINKISVSAEESEKKNSSSKRREDSVKQVKQTYKIVFLNEKGEPHDLTAEEVRQLIGDRPELEQFFTNPQSISEQALALLENDSWQKAATKVVNQCLKLKGAYYFAEPVDPVKYNIMDYFDIVTRPMDLNTVRRKLAYNCYGTAGHFMEEMNLVWGNCYKYNGEQHVVSKCAKELQNSFNELVESQGLSKYLNIS